jgi:uncharacterized protein YecT (DUF1311 family)
MKELPIRPLGAKMNKIIRLFFIVITMLSFSTAVLAASEPEQKINSSTIPDFSKACSSGAKDEVSLGQCLAEVNDKTGRYLRKLEEMIVNQLDPEEKKLFQKASKAWLQFVALTCEYDISSLGSMRGSVNSRCHTQLHLSRIVALEKYQTCLIQKDCGAPQLLYIELVPDN